MPTNLRGFWQEKTRVFALAYGFVCVILLWAVLVQCQLVSGRQTHDDTYTAPDRFSQIFAVSRHLIVDY